MNSNVCHSNPMVCRWQCSQISHAKKCSLETVRQLKCKWHKMSNKQNYLLVAQLIHLCWCVDSNGALFTTKQCTSFVHIVESTHRFLASMQWTATKTKMGQTGHLRQLMWQGCTSKQTEHWMCPVCCLLSEMLFSLPCHWCRRITIATKTSCSRIMQNSYKSWNRACLKVITTVVQPPVLLGRSQSDCCILFKRFS